MLYIDKKSQLEAKEYVLNKVFARPKTTVWSPVLLFLASIFFGVIIGFVITEISKLYLSVPLVGKVVIVLMSTLISVFITMKRVLILAVQCYQHYASEYVRRCCLCKPTCSEYAILVLKKYSLWKSLRLIYVRLKVTCSGDLYKVDFP